MHQRNPPYNILDRNKIPSESNQKKIKIKRKYDTHYESESILPP